MAERLILIDTSILIDFFRKTDKSKSTLLSLVEQGFNYCISAISEYEIYTGANIAQSEYWEKFLQQIDVLPFDKDVARKAVEINMQLKKKRKQIAIPDLFIAATAHTHSLPIATLNKKHFERLTPF